MGALIKPAVLQLALAASRWLLAACLLCGASGAARAAISVTAVTVNGAATTTVAPGANITINVTVVLTNGSKWRATSFTTTPTSSLSWCYFSPNINGNGTYTRSFTVPAPTAVGTFSLNTRAYTGSQCSGTISPTRTLNNAIVTGTPAAALNHVRIIHDGSALTCGVEAVALRACANAACSTLFTGSVTVNLGAGAGTWAVNPVTFSGGNGSVNLTNASAGTVTLAGTVTAPAAGSSTAVCYRGSTAGDCAMVFTNASCGFDAVEQTKGPNTPIFTKRIGGALTLDVLALNNGVLNTSSSANVGATLVAGTTSGCTTTALSPTVNFSFTGANAGRRSVTFSPSAAARNVRVRMVAGSVVACSSDNFAIRPSSLVLTAGGVGADAAGASVSASPALKASTTNFSLTAAGGTGYDGVPVINPDMVQSSSATAGVVAGVFSAGAAGSAQGTVFTYSEVGYFRLGQYGIYDTAFADVDENKGPPECFGDAALGTAGVPADPNVVAADGRLGCYFGNTAATSYFGRFIPDNFAVSDATISNRSAIAACSASTFSYLGEAFKPVFTLTAKNGDGDTTTNYDGAFARLDLATQLGLGAIDAPASGARTPFAVCGATPAHPCYTPGALVGAFADGEASDVEVPLTLFRGPTPVAPLTAFQVGIAPIDSDGVRIGSYDIDTVNVVAGAPNHALAGTTIARYGRMGIDNAYGSELLNLTLNLKAQYWNGLGYSTNTLDSCTPLAFSPFAAGDYKGGITAVNMPFAKLVAGPALVGGAGKLVLTKPGPPAPAAKGSVDVRSSLPYLPGSARATFGVYRAGPVIYVRETY
ncbi:MAG: DUF6701 domain-containing protein [Pseudomonadota bacterium]